MRDTFFKCSVVVLLALIAANAWLRSTTVNAAPVVTHNYKLLSLYPDEKKQGCVTSDTAWAEFTKDANAGWDAISITENEIGVGRTYNCPEYVILEKK